MYSSFRDDMEYALDKLDGEDLDGRRIKLSEEKRYGSRSRSRSRSRNRFTHLLFYVLLTYGYFFIQNPVFFRGGDKRWDGDLSLPPCLCMGGGR